jgi:hypothetical protein
VWKCLHKHKKAEAGTLDLTSLIENMEKSVLLLGQANVTTLLHMRVGMMSNIVGSNKKAQELVRGEKHILSSSHVLLYAKTEFRGKPRNWHNQQTVLFNISQWY